MVAFDYIAKEVVCCLCGKKKHGCFWITVDEGRLTQPPQCTVACKECIIKEVSDD